MTTKRKICRACLDFHEEPEALCGSCAIRRTGHGLQAVRESFDFYWANPTQHHYAHFLAQARSLYAAGRIASAERLEHWLAYAERVLGLPSSHTMAHA